MVDGALGMAYGLVASTVMLSLGVPPAQASASVHAAEIFTTAASATSHTANRNVDWPLFWRIAPTGVLGGIIGAFVLTGIDGNAMRPYIAAYLALMGVIILSRAIRWNAQGAKVGGRWHPLLAFVGGISDAIGGGGWGPVVSSTLLGRGGAPRYVIGTVNTVEFFVTTAISAAFVTALLTGHWQDADGLMEHGVAVAGLVVGGICAAPVAGLLVRLLPQRTLMALVGIVVLAVAGTQAGLIALR
ncbi:MAG: sulfite exporter TauE/SafE family protein [Devosia sp.]